jgi:23S rRNA (adenine2030-N6)-methyltransferase
VNYRHIFHAGNFADVFKHLVLCLCLEKFHEKNNGFFALDTHAGSAKYQLSEAIDLNNFEAQNGIIKILNQKNFQEILPISFLKILARINICEIKDLPKKIKYYSGSPIIIKNFLRSQDRAIFIEKSPEVFYHLKRNFQGNKKIICENIDGFSSLKSKLPPLENRGLIIIDPAYEKFNQKISSDYQNCLTALNYAQTRFAHGVYLLWYPIVKGQENLLNDFYLHLKKLKFNNILQIIFDLGFDKNTNLTTSIILNNSPHKIKMNSCGLFVFNAPWQLEEKLNFYLPKILNVLKNSNNFYYKIF